MNALQCTQKGLGQIDLIIGLGLGMAVMTMTMQAWGMHRQWLLERDVRTELQERTPFLHKMLMRLSRQAGSRALTWDGQAWQVEPAYAALPPGIGPTWVHARAIQASPALDPNCQNTRVWANQANAAPALIQDQFAWVDGQLKCKDMAQDNARWQGWVEQVRGWQAMLAWQTVNGERISWRWRPVDQDPGLGMARGVRLCLTMDSVWPTTARPGPITDCNDRPLSDQARAWRVWTRIWSLRVGAP